MDIHRSLKICSKNICKTILFGETTTDAELQDIYRLRYSVYSRRGYIDNDKYKDGIEKDEYDEKGLCRYFIAKIDGVLIGAIRIIINDPLPTEQSFSFDEPTELKIVPRSQRAELGRFIIIPPDKGNGVYLPRGLVMLFLLDTLSSYGLKNNLLGGYAFVKKSLEHKMRRLRLPFGEIATYNQIYPKDGVLSKYFTQKNDPVIPIYFLTKDFSDYSEKRIRSSFMFKKTGDNDYVLRHNLYTIFLKLLKII